jgi:MFS family permease
MKQRNLIAQCFLNFGLGAYWCVENFWINMYWSREINPELGYISAMVSITAVVAVFTMIVFGALSDSSKSKFGRRKVFIFWGGIIGGIFMFLFPITKQIHVAFGLTAAIVYAVMIDVFITLFGDWTTPTRLALFNEHTVKNERGKINAIIGLASGIGTSIIMGMYILNVFDNKIFFYVCGVMMWFGSTLSVHFFEDPGMPDNPRSFKDCIREITRRDSYEKNKGFYFLLGAIAIQFFGTNIYSNYMMVYAENVLLYTPMQVGVMSVLGALIGFCITIPSAIISDNRGRKRIILRALIIYLIFCTLFTFIGGRSFWYYAIFFGFMSAFIGSVDAVATAWVNDLTPPNMRGSLLAYLMAVKVIPMTPGSIIGAVIGETLAPPGVLYSNLMFFVGGIIAFMSFFLYKKVEDSIKTEEK